MHLRRGQSQPDRITPLALERHLKTCFTYLSWPEFPFWVLSHYTPKCLRLCRLLQSFSNSESAPMALEGFDTSSSPQEKSPKHFIACDCSAELACFYGKAC